MASGSVDFLTATLERALGRSRCAICELRAETEERWLWTFLWELVNDPGVREQLAAAWGFCPRHGWRLHAVARQGSFGGLGPAIVFADLGQRLAALLASDGRQPGRLVARLEPARCRPCLAGEQSEETYLQWLVGNLDRPSFRERYAAAGGVCLPHLRTALEQTSQPGAARFLIDVARKRLERLVARRSGEEGGELVTVLAGRDPDAASSVLQS